MAGTPEMYGKNFQFILKTNRYNTQSIYFTPSAYLQSVELKDDLALQELALKTNTGGSKSVKLAYMEGTQASNFVLEGPRPFILCQGHLHVCNGHLH